MRAQLRAQVSRHYSGPLHFAFTLFTDEDFAPEGRRDWAFVLFPPPLVLGYLGLVVPFFAVLSHFAISANVGYLVGATAAVFFFLYEVINFGSHVGEAAPSVWRVLRPLGELQKPAQ
jgi:hypothetical protein